MFHICALKRSQLTWSG